MIFISSIIVILILQNFAVAADASIPGSWHYSYIIAIIIASICITIIFITLAFLTLRYMKKKFSQPQYYVDDVSIQKEGFEPNEMVSEIPNLHQIQPILTVSHVVSSMRQALEDLGNAITPQRWSTQAIKETPMQEKTDLPI